MPESAAPELTARRYAAQLLRDLAVEPPATLDLSDAHPAVTQARCGLMALSGEPQRPPQLCPAPLAACADGALAALASLAPTDRFAGLRGSALLTERAAVFGHGRNGRQSPGGSCRLLDAADGRVALNLARVEDWDSLPAWLESGTLADWDAVAAAVRTRETHELLERGRLLGLALAQERWVDSAPWFSATGGQPRTARRSAPRVLDLSSLWAGPLCSHLLQRCGADVVKLESTRRPDGARQGPAAFFDLLNAGKRSVALDFATAEGRTQLHALLEQADIVIEASRPRALRQLGIVAEQCVEDYGLTWISLTGYGRAEPQAQWIAYGDDAGVAAGLSQLMAVATGSSMFVGDAIADPLTGLHAALAAWSTHQSGGGRLISLTLVDVVRHGLGFEAPGDDLGWKQRHRLWCARLGPEDVQGPQLRMATAAAAALGADTTAVFADWGLTC